MADRVQYTEMDCLKTGFARLRNWALWVTGQNASVVLALYYPSVAAGFGIYKSSEVYEEHHESPVDYLDAAAVDEIVSAAHPECRAALRRVYGWQMIRGAIDKRDLAHVTAMAKVLT